LAPDFLDLELVHHLFEGFGEPGQLLGQQVDLAAAGGHLVLELMYSKSVLLILKTVSIPSDRVIPSDAGLTTATAAMAGLNPL
jgi:hypothetical protein